jgi:hypothetical protein
MRYQAEAEERGAEAAGELAAGVEITGVGAQAYAVGKQSQR